MDPNVLKQKNVEPRNPRLGFVKNYELRIGEKATLLRAPAAKTHGLVSTRARGGGLCHGVFFLRFERYRKSGGTQ